jgi:hypothetical protein
MKKGAFSHFANRNLCRLLRNFPWPIRNKILTQKPIECSANTGTLTVVLCEPRHFLEGCWSLRAWMHYLHDVSQPLLLVDGAISAKMQRQFDRIFRCRVKSLYAINDIVQSGDLSSHMQQFKEGHRFGAKFAALSILHRSHNVLYSDFDVLALSRPNDLMQLLQTPNASPAFLSDPVGFPVDPHIGSIAMKFGLQPNSHFNAGLVWVPRNSLEPRLSERIIEEWCLEKDHHFAEQTLLSALMGNANAVSLPESRNVLSWQGAWAFSNDLNCAGLETRHYVGPVRHRMYSTGYPWVSKMCFQ